MTKTQKAELGFAITTVVGSLAMLVGYIGSEIIKHKKS